MSSVNNLVNPAVSVSGEVDTLLIEKFDGQVKLAYKEMVNMMRYFDLKEVVGTNSVSNKYMGTTQVQGLAPGADVKGTQVEFDKNQLVIDTVVIARNNVGILADVQDDINTKGKLAVDQVEQLGMMEDRMLIQQIAYGAIKNTRAKRSKPRVRGHGFSVDVKVEEKTMEYPNAVQASLEAVLEAMVKQNVPIQKIAAIMDWTYFNTLRDAERIVNATYTTASGTTVNGFVLKSYNLPIIPTNQMPNKDRDQQDLDGNTSAHHLLSNANNGYRYDVISGLDNEDNMDNVVAVLFGSEGLMVGRSISLQGKIWMNDNNKTWYIDSWMSEGAIPDRWEHLGIVRVVNGEKASEDTAVRKRANRKVIPVSNTPLTIA